MLFLVTLLLFSIVNCKNITIIKDGKEVDIEKQRAEENLIEEDEVTKIKTEKTEIETELLDNSAYGGSKIVQEYDITKDPNEDIIIEIVGETDTQLVIVRANETDTDIEIDIDREGKESLDVEFDVDHEGESYRVDEYGKEEYRVDEQELKVYIEEHTSDNYVIRNDNIEVEVYVDIDDIDLEDNDYVDFDIGLYGEKDDETNDDVFISGRYRNKKKERVPDPAADDPKPADAEPTPTLSSIYTGTFTFRPSTNPPSGAATDPPEIPENLISCVSGPVFNIPSNRVIRSGRRFEQGCDMENVPKDDVLLYGWVRIDPISRVETPVTDSGTMVLRSSQCLNAATYKCKVTYLCEGAVVEAVSPEMNIVVDKGLVLNPICQIFGDPHVITFDQRIYSFQGECTYLLAMDARQGNWYIYGMFTKCGEGTCLEAITVYAKDYSIQLMRGWIVNQNGIKLPIKEGQSLSPDNTMSLYYDGYEVYVELHDPQIQLTWDGLMNIKIEIASEDRSLGLCGNNNGNPEDDFMTFYGDVLDDPLEFGHRQAIDRRGTCKRPVQLNYEGETAEAREHCEKVLLSGLFSYVSGYLEVQAARRGQDNEVVRSDRLMDMCVFDYVAGMSIEALTAECYAGYNYMSMARRLGLCLPEGWQTEVGCIGKMELQDITISQGCPWGDTPLPFNRL